MRERKTVVSKLLNVAVLLAITPSLTGCGVVFGGTRQHIQISSTPDSATVRTAPATGDFKTPASIDLQRKQHYQLTLSTAGYTSQMIEMKRSMRKGIVVLDVVLCCVTVIVDAVTGGWYKLEPQQVTATLTKTAANISGPDQITVTLNAKPTKTGAIQVESSVPGVSVDVAGH